jgi:hypothetical protein
MSPRRSTTIDRFVPASSTFTERAHRSAGETIDPRPMTVEPNSTSASRAAARRGETFELERHVGPDQCTFSERAAETGARPPRRRTPGRVDQRAPLSL